MGNRFQRLADLTEGEWPAELRSLTSDKRRLFVLHYLNHRNGARASREAGYLPEEATAEDHTQNAYKLLHDEGICDAIIAMTKRQLRSLAPEAINAIKETLQTTFHKDRMRAAAMILERTDSVTQKVDVTHTHKFDPIKITLDELSRLKLANASKEAIMLALGFQTDFELEHYEKLLAKEVPIDAEYRELPAPERDPDADLLGE
jgi:phage terminase small subunit